jgi:serine/threonine-protein kinase
LVEVGEVLGNHHILARLGAGGMATLYLGAVRCPTGIRQVALKVVHDHLADRPGFLTMFRDEARLASRIDHPNVARVEGLRQDDGRHYLVMEYVSGQSMAQHLDHLASGGARMPVELAVAIVIRAARGLHAAHEARGEDGEPLGLVHRDVSPGNILVSDDGDVKLIDFGIAKARGRQYETTGRRIRGKLRYLSPEQVRSGALDRRADVYSLAVVLWEMLALHRYALGRSEHSLIMNVAKPRRRPLSTLRRDIPSDLEEVLARALDPKVDGRFESALAFECALTSAVPAAADVYREDIARFFTDATEEVQLPPSYARRPRPRPRPSPPPRPLSTLRPRTATREPQPRRTHLISMHAESDGQSRSARHSGTHAPK